MHGAGYPKREREGKRQPPAIAALKHGQFAHRQTFRRLAEADPAVLARAEEILAEGSEYEVRETLAVAKALCERLVSEEGVGATSIQALAVTIRMIRDALEAEAKCGEVRLSDIREIVRVYSDALERFVPPKKLEEARGFVRAGLARIALGREG